MAGGIYIHIPFCLKKCFYCDFYSEAADDKDLRALYTGALLADIEFYGKKYGKASGKASGKAPGSFEADTIFFGGGTPSLMEPEHIEAVISALKEKFNVAENAEISMEANPATLSAAKLSGYRKAGVNRLSIGAQSFDDRVLEGLGRVHRACDIAETVAMARQAGFDNINLDLMFAVPNQTMDIWKESLEKIIYIKPEHISFYSLEIAENTPFGRWLEEGKLAETPVAEDRQMYSLGIEMLEAAGYEHYEISNMALSGRECRHNLKYWQMDDYLGLGPSAHSFMEGERFFNVGNVYKYIEMSPDERVQDIYQNSLDDNASEFVFTALRTKDGVSLEAFKERIGVEFWQHFKDCREEFEKYVLDGYAVCDETHIALTAKGIDISNKIMAIFV